MDAAVILALIALVLTFGLLFTGVRIAKDLQSRGFKAKPIDIRWMLFKYLAQYRKTTESPPDKEVPDVVSLNISATTSVTTMTFLS